MTIAKALRRIGSSLAAKAESVVITYRTPTAYTPGTGLTATTESSTTGGAVVEEYSWNEIGSLVEAGDLKVTISAKDFALPSPEDLVTIDGVPYEIVLAEQLSWGLDAVAYTLQARRGGMESGAALVGGFSSGFSSGFSGGSS